LADYRVNLDIFAGPLDLLLYLVRKEEVDIYDIPIAKITDQYIRYIEMLKSLDIDLAGSFLVMAATLMQIKSAMLLPRAEPESALGQDDDLTDPRAELIRQLLEYKKFKDAANLLNAAADEQRERFSRPDSIIAQLKPRTEPEIDLEQASVWDLLEAFDSIMKATGSLAEFRVRLRVQRRSRHDDRAVPGTFGIDSRKTRLGRAADIDVFHLFTPLDREER